MVYQKEVAVERALHLVESIILKFSLLGIPAPDLNMDNFSIEGDHFNNNLIMVDGYSPKKRT